MSEVLTKAYVHTNNINAYRYIEYLFENMFSENVEEYHKEDFCIELQEELATQDVIVKVARVLDKSMRAMVGELEEPVRSQWSEALYFKITATSKYSADGMQCEYIIERDSERMTICETDKYIYVHQEDDSATYEEFCECFSEYFDPETDEFISEEDFDPTAEFYVTYGKVYVNEKPPYGERCTLN